MPVEVREADAADLDALVEIAEEVAQERLWIGLEAPIDKSQWRERCSDAIYANDQSQLIALVDGRPVGQLRGKLFRGIADFGMMVVTSARGSGVGSALLEQYVAWAHEHDAHKVSLQAWTHNRPAIRLYERFGFEIEGHLRRHWKRADGSLWDAYIMGLVLDHESPGSPEVS